VATILLDGTIFGGATLPPFACALGHLLQGSAQGTSTVQMGSMTRTILVSGIVRGTGTLSLIEEPPLHGTIQGIAFLSDSVMRGRSLHGHGLGTSRMVLAEPLPICGQGIMSVFLIVRQEPRPVWCKSHLQAFRWGQALQRGDLSVWLTQPGKGPISPFKVSYALYQGLPGCVPLLVGPPERVPVKGNVGEYYSVWRAGDGGQPGRWRIVWHYQVTYDGPIFEDYMCFMVNDAIAAGSCPPKCTRQRGWF